VGNSFHTLAALARGLKPAPHHVDDLDMIFSSASLAVLGLTILGTAVNLYIMRRRPRGQPAAAHARSRHRTRRLT
jgi:hypothetical protein